MSRRSLPKLAECCVHEHRYALRCVTLREGRRSQHLHLCATSPPCRHEAMRAMPRSSVLSRAAHRGARILYSQGGTALERICTPTAPRTANRRKQGSHPARVIFPCILVVSRTGRTDQTGHCAIQCDHLLAVISSAPSRSAGRKGRSFQHAWYVSSCLGIAHAQQQCYIGRGPCQ